MVGQGKVAVKALEERIQKTTSPDNMMLSRLVGGQAFIQLLSGDLASAERASQRLRAVAEDDDNAHLVAWSDHLIGLARLQSYRLTEALDSFLSSAELRHICHVGAAVDAQAGLVLTLQALQRTVDAEEAMAQLLEFARGTTDQRHLTVAESCQARLALLRGDLESADRWARSFDEEANAASALFWLEVPLLTKARTQVAVGSPENLESAFASLDELERQAAALHFTCRTIETMALRAVILEKQGRHQEALTTLGQLITDAGSGGWVRPFVEAGPVMAQMLERLDLEGDDGIFVRRVVTAFGPAGGAETTEVLTPTTAEPPDVSPREPSVWSGRPPLDALTDRELDVLELLQERLYNKEIASKLGISTHTVNYHLKHIYQKLDVNSRRNAVRRGVEKGILQHSQP
jgi:LuxR family maltose regulon positive regulatory protein